jgi:hypothetical protein
MPPASGHDKWIAEECLVCNGGASAIACGQALRAWSTYRGMTGVAGSVGCGAVPGGVPAGAGADSGSVPGGIPVVAAGAGAGTVPGASVAGSAAGAAPRATRTPRDFIQALNSSAVMFLPFWLMLKRHGVLSNSVRGL